MTKQDNAHSPLPWTYEKSRYRREGEYDCAIGQDGWLIAECFGRLTENTGDKIETRTENAVANAAFIVEACNSYYQNKTLISELEGVLEQAKRYITGEDVLYRAAMLKNIDAALSKAKGAAQ